MLQIAGEGRAKYQLDNDKPIHIYDGEIHVGVIQKVLVSDARRRVLLDRLVASENARHKRISMNLMLLEVLAFLATHFPTVTVISLCLNSAIEGHDFLGVARARAHILRRIGAKQIHIAPNFESRSRGHFSVTGVWIRKQQTLKGLETALRSERRTHMAGKARAAKLTGRLAFLGAHIKRWLSGSTESAL